MTQDVRESVTPLQEISQKRYGKTPKYDITRVSGGSHDPCIGPRCMLTTRR